MLAFSASVNQPDVDFISVRIDPESAGVDEFLLLMAASAAMEYPDGMKLSPHASLRLL